MHQKVLGFLYTLGVIAEASSCPSYSDYSKQLHGPYSSGRYHLAYQRPSPKCRTFNSSGVEDTVTRYKDVIKDPDLYRLFQNAYPNSLDTAIKWKGYAKGTDEELTFIITGDINAMWLRDSANQMQSYVPLLNASSSPNSIASLYRGVINLQSRYLQTSPYCNSFQPPVESRVPPSVNGAASDDKVHPKYSKLAVFECKFELDSLAAFLEVSHDYYAATQDAAFFAKYSWVKGVEAVLAVAESMLVGTYAANGSVVASPYTFTRLTTAGTETLSNGGIGNPVRTGTGLVRSAFRPSDDATVFQLFVPANMMFSRYLAACADIMRTIPGTAALVKRMTDMADTIRRGIAAHAIVHDPHWGSVYAYEVDGYGARNLMDDANIPSLLSAPLLGFVDATDPVYQATRKMILSRGNPYFMRGPVISAVGGPHVGPGHAWPMASIVRVLTSDNDTEIAHELKTLVSSTAGLGLIHESVNSFNATDWTRQWFSWANGLFGQMIIDLEGRKPHLLAQSYQ